jgi:hypothetical protein
MVKIITSDIETIMKYKNEWIEHIVKCSKITESKSGGEIIGWNPMVKNYLSEKVSFPQLSDHMTIVENLIEDRMFDHVVVEETAMCVYISVLLDEAFIFAKKLEQQLVENETEMTKK